MGTKSYKQRKSATNAERPESPSKAWLSNGVELLFERQGLNKNGEPFDIVIVGSGYGGAIAASELSELGLSICLLERGREFLPGSFPTSMNEAPTEFRTSGSGAKPNGNLEGLFDIRLNDDLNVVQANGLGGGSLINAGVMARAKDELFEGDRWPTEINAEDLKQYYHDAELLLGSKNLDEDGTAQPNTILLHNKFKDSNLGPEKYESLKKLSQASTKKGGYDAHDSDVFRNANITVNMSDLGKSSAGVPLNACNLCGDCASGCNNNAKISLDKNLLINAARNGVEIFTGATVLKFQAAKNHNWTVNVVYTDTQLRSRQSQASLALTTSNLILSAGALGSTEILKRSESTELPFSSKLGEQFSSNGDMLAVGFQQNQIANAIANHKVPYSRRNIGPTITGMIDLRDHPNSDKRIVIQEMAVPAAAGFFFKELYSTINTVQTLWNSDKTVHKNGSDFIDPAALSENSMRSTSLYAVMGDDGANGRLVLDPSDNAFYEGTIQVKWPMLKEHPLFDHQIDTLNTLSDNKENKLGGTILPNPVWQLLKPEHMNMMNVERGAPLTVHPLGGCPMGTSTENGAVNHRGQLFKPNAAGASTDTYQGLMVLDGAIIPEAVGINPALTISAVSLKAIRELVKLKYFSPSTTQKVQRAIKPYQKRFDQAPVIRTLAQLEGLSENEEKQTEVQIAERLVGFSKLESDEGTLKDVVIEVTLWSKPIGAAELSKKSTSSDFTDIKILVDDLRQDDVTGLPLSKIRLYDRSDWNDIRSGKINVDKHEVALDRTAKFIGQVNGQLTAFSRAESYALSRIIDAGWAWLFNRGLRDVYQASRPRYWERQAMFSPRRKSEKKSWLGRFINLARTLSRAGEIRTLNYDLTIISSLKTDDFSYFGSAENSKTSIPAKKIIGVKRLTYQRRANPWSQLSEVFLQQIPSKNDRYNKHKDSHHESTQSYKTLQKQQKKLARRGNSLTLDTNYLTKAGIPLVQITQQDNQVKALMDLTSIGSYVARILIGVHFYSFRAPDSPEPRNATRLAGKVDGLPMPSVQRLLVDKVPDDRVHDLPKGSGVEIVLTHFAHRKPTKAPVMMLHGYSGSSAFFAHFSTPKSLAKFFHDDERDVWLVDLRTSAALSSARYPWTFESVSSIDIPRAVEHIYNYYQGKNKIDVITHCMGSVMLGMSILRINDEIKKRDDQFFKNRINRIVFSQATPTLVFTQDNNFRSFATSYLKEMIPDDYQFQVKDGEKASQILDRILYTLPYPNEEFDIINAPLSPSRRAEFARTRHRVDAFFSRTFELANLTTETLDHIDDFFGPIHVDTIIQASRFANGNVATNARGGNVYVSREQLQQYWSGIPTMSFHSRSNGLIDFSTGQRTERIFLEAGLPYKSIVINDETYGHQDSIIGKRAHLDVFPHIANFLDEVSESDTEPSHEQDYGSHHGWVVEAPAYGPIIIDSLESSEVKIMLGSNTARACKPLCIFVPIIVQQNKLQLVGKNTQERVQILDEYVARSLELQSLDDGEEISRWNIINLPESLLNQPETSTTNDMNGLAALMIYDDLVGLDNRFVVGGENEGQQSMYLGKVHNTINSDNNLRVIISDVIKGFLGSNLNVYHEFSKSVIELNARSSAQKDSSGLSEMPSAALQKPLTFALGSCQYPAGMLDKEVAYNSYQQLNQRLDSNEKSRPSFVALVGDQIYADATAGFLDPSTKFDQFVLPYYRLYENQHVRSVLRKVPLYAMLDDHELSDNWEPVINNPTRQTELNETLSVGVKSFLKYQRGQITTPNTDATGKEHEQLWYSFKQNDYHFFMCDTRTERSARTAESILAPQTTIMSPTQDAAINDWLAGTSKDKAKFILSSSMFLPRHRLNHASTNSAASCIRSDGWDGYPVSLFKILAMVVDNDVEHLVFLSGDEHIGCYAEIEIHNLSTGKSAYAVSAHCPGLYTPFPFANARVDDFEGQLDNASGQSISQFEFQQDGSKYQCQVRADFNIGSDGIQLGPIKIELCGGFLIINAT